MNCKKILALILAASCAVAALAMPAAAAEEGSFANFNRSETYAAGLFDDVDETAWYYENVKAAYELGLMKGSGDSFNTTGKITLAETAALAARLHSIYHTGSAKFEQGEPWYQVYVDYALENGILSKEYADYGAEATRMEFASILARALPERALPAINAVADGQIPDVKMDMDGADEVYMLYRAGILTGNNARGKFAPETPIERSAVSAIVTRMAYRSLRVKYELAVSTYPDLSEKTAADDSFFDDAAMLGNSLAQGMELYSKLPMDFYTKEGIRVDSADSYVDQLCKKQYGKVYIELGINEIYMTPSAFAEAYGKIIDRIRAAMPDAEIYIMAVTPVTKDRDSQGSFTMKRINAFNEALYGLAEEMECWYLDVCTPLENSNGFLTADYAGWDGSPHLSSAGYLAWADIIRTYYN